ncbi:type II toxin-antitoxin system HicA family toxin [Mucilaginibacter paludis]|uniref:YcfA family protein n=1 Tax=Mucilaginibacter paludis DSM 18603 TaxID=714943 RepID=H1Y9H3_9SPHI|nr:type II toxin-antitoxin system HicA family toxin [Mucilaginibacter paludis]EHQ29978.1 YcfA family protein [Mucilaginibacter paludis DSM 18603]
MVAKLSRNFSGRDLVKLLSRYGYEVVRQNGSHIRLTLKDKKGSHHITIPNHDPLKIGTLSAILNEVSSYLGIPKDDLT